MQKFAAREYEQAEIVENEEVRNIDVLSDGTWMTPVHPSMTGAATVIGCQTGQVLGAGTRRKACKLCQVWTKRDRNTASYMR